MSPTSLTYYPVYTHKAHPLDGTWIKLSAKLVEDLIIPPGWEASHPGIDAPAAAPPSAMQRSALFFYLNHPLPYIQLCGVVAEITIENRFPFVKLVLDDSSGFLATILVKKWIDPNESKLEDNSGILAKNPVTERLKATECAIRCCGWISDKVFDIQPVRIGSVLRVKGRVSDWERGRQILMEKYDIFHSTAQEVNYWREMSRDFKKVLTQPWHISQQHMTELIAEFERERHAREKQALRIERRARRERKEKKSRASDGSKSKRDRKVQIRAGASEGLPAPVPTTSPSDDARLPCAVLAPSYQIPKKDSTTETSSSLDRQLSSLTVHGDLMPGSRTDVLNKFDGMDLAIKNPAQRSSGSNKSSKGSFKQQSTFSPSNTKEEAANESLELVDGGAPSNWEQLDLSTEDSAAKTVHGADWLKLRDKLLSTRSLSTNIPVQEPDPKHLFSTIEEWSDIVL